MRLWQLASVKYITAPANVLSQLNGALKQQLTPVMFYRFVQQGDGVGVQSLKKPTNPQDQVLMEFNAFVPRFALFHHWESMPFEKQCAALFAPAFDPLKSVLVSGFPESSTEKKNFVSVHAETSVKDARIQVNSGQRGVLLFTQRYQPEWRARIDGKPVEVLRCNYLCMGVLVPAGEHDVKFYLESK